MSNIFSGGIDIQLHITKMMFRGGSLPQPISNDLAVASIIDQLGLGLKQYQDDKRVQMLSNHLQYLKARNAAYTAIAASAGAVYHGALYQIPESVTAGVPDTVANIAARATALAGNAYATAVSLFANWADEIKNASRLLWVKRLAAETAMKRLRARLDAVDAQFPLEGEAKNPKGKLIIETEKQPRRKYPRPSTVNDAIAATDLFFCVYIHRLQ